MLASSIRTFGCAALYCFKGTLPQDGDIGGIGSRRHTIDHHLWLRIREVANTKIVLTPCHQQGEEKEKIYLSHVQNLKFYGVTKGRYHWDKGVILYHNLVFTIDFHTHPE